jgi:hypothetical protein
MLVLCVDPGLVMYFVMIFVGSLNVDSAGQRVLLLAKTSEVETLRSGPLTLFMSKVLWCSGAS